MITYLPTIVLLATFIFAFTSIYGKIIIIKIENFYHFFLLQIFLTGLLFLLFNLIFIRPDISSLFRSNKLILIFLSSILAFIGFITLYKGFEVGNVSVGGVLLSARVIATIPISILLIGEVFPEFVYFLILIAVLGSFLVSWSKDLLIKDLLKFKSSGMGYFLITLFVWSFANTIVRELNNEFHPLFFLLVRSIIFGIIALLTYPFLNNVFANKRKIKISRNIFLHSLVYSFILISAQSLFVWALGESLLVTEAIGVFEGVITFIFAILLSFIPYFKNYLKEPLEKITVFIRSVGAFITTIATLGVILIAT